MRYNHFTMLPEKAFSPRAFGSMTLEGGGGGGGPSQAEIELEALKKQMKEREERDAQLAALKSPPGFQHLSPETIAYSQAFRPGYQEFGPSGQFQQPIYRSSYEGYVQPAAFYTPSYDVPSFYNPFANYSGLMQALGQQGTSGAKGEASKASGGTVQGIDALLK